MIPLIITAFLFIASPSLNQLPQEDIIHSLQDAEDALGAEVLLFEQFEHRAVEHTPDKYIKKDLRTLCVEIDKRVMKGIDKYIVTKLILQRRFGKRIKRVLLINRYDMPITNSYFLENIHLEVIVNDGRVYKINFNPRVNVTRMSHATDQRLSVSYVTGHRFHGITDDEIIRLLMTAQ